MDELALALQELGVEPSTCQRAARALDLDQSGEVEYTEFVAGCLNFFDDNLDHMLWQAFQRFDTDGSGWPHNRLSFCMACCSVLQQCHSGGSFDAASFSLMDARQFVLVASALPFYFVLSNRPPPLDCAARSSLSCLREVRAIPHSGLIAFPPRSQVVAQPMFAGE